MSERRWRHLRGQALSVRELEVLTLIMAGMMPPEIRAKLWIAPGTLEAHRARILCKLDARNMPHAVALHLTAAHRAMASAGVAY